MGRIITLIHQDEGERSTRHASIARLRPHLAGRENDSAWGLQDIAHHRYQVLAMCEKGGRESRTDCC